MGTETAITQLKQIEKINKLPFGNLSLLKSNAVIWNALGKDFKINMRHSQPRLAVEWREKWKSLISTILSSQTKDTTTIKYSEILYKKYPNLKSLSNAKQEDVERIIRPINYHKTKAKHIIETAKILVKKRKIPDTREELMELPGVGRKVANVYLVHAHNMACIGVDTHVNFLANAMRWTKEEKQEKIEKDLENLFPKKYWNSINWVLVRFGQIFPSRNGQVEVLKENGII